VVAEQVDNAPQVDLERVAHGRHGTCWHRQNQTEIAL
jgi:hypothetical protein